MCSGMLQGLRNRGKYLAYSNFASVQGSEQKAVPFLPNICNISPHFSTRLAILHGASLLLSSHEHHIPSLNSCINIFNKAQFLFSSQHYKSYLELTWPNKAQAKRSGLWRQPKQHMELETKLGCLKTVSHFKEKKWKEGREREEEKRKNTKCLYLVRKKLGHVDDYLA